MKINDHYHKGPVQDLLNAVVVQAVEDYREYSAKLIVQPGSRQAAKDLEEVISFFLSEDFCFYTSVPGADILHRLEKEQEENRKIVEAFRELKVELARARQAFVESNYCDEAILEKGAIIAASLKDMSRQAKRQWKQLFRLERRDKKMMQDFENWRRELKWQKIAS